jgi:hypothetical protein
VTRFSCANFFAERMIARSPSAVAQLLFSLYEHQVRPTNQDLHQGHNPQCGCLLELALATHQLREE